MKYKAIFTIAALSVLMFAMACQAEVKTVTGHNSNESATFDFKFKNAPQPSRSDAATKATFTIVDGRRDRNGGNLDKLNDGKVPTEEDEPSENFFFNAGTDGGRVLIDLGAAIVIRQVNTYSWHPNTRGPQLYKFYASNGEADGFSQQPKNGTDPQTCGWKLIANVDTRPPEGTGGGQYAVSISDSDGTIGKYQYLLFDISATEQSDPFGNTFFSEIDVVVSASEASPAVPANQPTGEVQREIVEADGGRYRITIETTGAPDLTEWAQKELAPVVQKWYPKIVKMLPSEGYEAPTRVSITFSAGMRGVAATGGTRVRCAASWFRRELQGEAKGAVVHELVHVVQNYGIARRTNPNPSRTPGWLVEGIADYIRWFLYEPETHGAEITSSNISRARYDGNYRISGNFLNWVTETYDRDIVRKLNAAAREGKYDEDLWTKLTGHTVQELGDEWKANLEKKLAAEHVKTFTFDNKETLAGWTITGDVTIDAAKGREGRSGSLKVGPGGKALLRLRDSDESGKVEFWVYDDGAAPEDPKAHRLGPRWGLVQSDGKLLAVGVLYASYLGGTEGYTATASDGRDWFNQLFWLGVNREPAGWHKWTFDFDAVDGLEIFHNDREVTAVDSAKVGLLGFSAVAIWGDAGQGNEQTIWLTDLSVTLGGPVETAPVPAEADPYEEETVAAEMAQSHPIIVYTEKNAPATAKLEDLPLKQSISQYGITWTFQKPARVGQLVNGDWYVVGPVTIESIDPKPLYGNEIRKRELDRMDRERKQEHRVRNGFMLNPPAKMEVAYDSGVRNWFAPSLIQRLPVTMKPGDSLVSTISMPKNLVLHAQLRNKIERGVDDSSPIRTAVVLTCVGEPQPPDAFRPGFCDRQQRIYLARNIKRDLLPVAAATKSMPKIQQYIRFTQRPWVGTCFFGFEEPVENMPQYGLEYGRVVGISALLLCTDLEPQHKEPLLLNFVQVGIDLGGMVRAGHPGWTAWGGHGSGRKLPIVLAGLLLGDDELANINRSFPKVSFGEDEQTAYGNCWTGAKVVFAGHSGIDAATGAGRSRGSGWGPYEHTPPSQWKDGQNTGESYRRCCTSVGWVAQALAMRLLHAEKSWNHDAFFDYVDRWMYEDDSAFVKTIREATGRDHDKEWARQGQAWDAFVNEMWAKHRPTLKAPIDAWKQKHDDAYYRKAIAE